MLNDVMKKVYRNARMIKSHLKLIRAWAVVDESRSLLLNINSAKSTITLLELNSALQSDVLILNTKESAKFSCADMVVNTNYQFTDNKQPTKFQMMFP